MPNVVRLLGAVAELPIAGDLGGGRLTLRLRNVRTSTALTLVAAACGGTARVGRDGIELVTGSSRCARTASPAWTSCDDGRDPLAATYVFAAGPFRCLRRPELVLYATAIGPRQIALIGGRDRGAPSALRRGDVLALLGNATWRLSAVEADHVEMTSDTGETSVLSFSPPP